MSAKTSSSPQWFLGGHIVYIVCPRKPPVILGLAWQACPIYMPANTSSNSLPVLQQLAPVFNAISVVQPAMNCCISLAGVFQSAHRQNGKIIPSFGGVAERPKALVLKTRVRVTGPWVQIPPPPPYQASLEPAAHRAQPLPSDAAGEHPRPACLQLLAILSTPPI